MTEIQSKESHFINGGSSFSRRKKCRGSLKMELPYWDLEDGSDDSALGTKIHKGGEALIPYAIKNWNREDPFEGAPPLKDDNGEDYSEEEIEAAQGYCKDILRLLGNKAPKISWVSEQKFIIDAELQLGGTADFAWGYLQKTAEFIEEHKKNFPAICQQFQNLDQKDLKVGHIWDYKNGTIPHDATTSDQIRQYIAGLQTKLGSGEKRPFDVIFGHIYGPNFRNQNLVKSTVVYTKAEVEEILIEQVGIAEEALGLHGDGPMKLHAGEHCFFCKAKAVCQEWDNFNRKNAQTILDRFDTSKAPAIIDSHEAKTIADTDFKKIIETKTDEEIFQFFLHIEYFQKAINAVKDFIRMRHLQGKPIQGLRLVQGTKRRKYKESLNEKEIGEKAQGWGIEKPWKKVPIKITDMEKQLGKIYRAQGMKPKDADQQAANMMQELCDYTEPKLAIILDDPEDPRQSLEDVNRVKANEVFGAVPLEVK